MRENEFEMEIKRERIIETSNERKKKERNIKLYECRLSK